MTPRPRAIYFDVGETLARPRQPYGDLVEEVGHGLGICLAPDAMRGLATHIDGRVAARSAQRLPFTFPAGASQAFWFDTYRNYFRDVLADMEARALALGMLELLSSPAGYVLYEDTLPALERLHAAEYVLGIVSNWEAWLPALLEATDIARFFTHTVISGVCGIEKPDPRIFTLAMEQGGFRPGAVVYVGDRPAHDVGPARAAGLVPVLLDRENRYPDRGAGARLRSLDELDAALVPASTSGAGNSLR